MSRPELHVLRAADGRPLLQTRAKLKAWAVHRTIAHSRLYLDGVLLSTMQRNATEPGIALGKVIGPLLAFDDRLDDVTRADAWRELDDTPKRAREVPRDVDVGDGVEFDEEMET